MRSCLLLSVLLLGGNLFAQRKVSGKIFNEWAAPVPDVQVFIPDSDISTRSAEDGSYEIVVPSSVKGLSFQGDSSYFWTIEKMPIPEKGPFHLLLINKVRASPDHQNAVPLRDSLTLYGHFTDRSAVCQWKDWRKHKGYDDPLIGLTVVAANAKLGTVSDFDGNIQLKIPPGLSNGLSTSYTGMETKKFLLPDVKVLYMEVPLMAYGTCEAHEKASEKTKRKAKRTKRKMERQEKKQKN